MYSNIFASLKWKLFLVSRLCFTSVFYYKSNFEIFNVFINRFSWSILKSHHYSFYPFPYTLAYYNRYTCIWNTYTGCNKSYIDETSRSIKLNTFSLAMWLNWIHSTVKKKGFYLFFSQFAFIYCAYLWIGRISRTSFFVGPVGWGCRIHRLQRVSCIWH